MQTANIMLDLGGDTGNQIPKLGVTPAEIAVLIAIHGESAVHDIEPAGDVPVNADGVRWTNRVELDRLRRVYGRAKNGEDTSHVDILFPGAAARVFETLDELNIPAEFYKPTARATAPVVEAAADEDVGEAVDETADVTPPPTKPDPLDHDGNGKKGGSKARKAKKAEPDEDGIADMPDNPKPDAGEALFA